MTVDVFRYFIHDADGNILSSGKVNVLPTDLPEGQTLVTVDGDQPLPWTHKFNLETSELEPLDAAPVIIKTAKDAELRARCKLEISSGFSSSASGTVRFYPSTDQDQTNMAQSAALGGKLMCRVGVDWSLVDHTSTQAQGVLSDFIVLRDEKRAAFAGKMGDLAAATTQDEVDAIEW